VLQGKRVVVVGGSSGIGLATAVAAAREGARVTIMGRSVERLEKAVTQHPQLTALSVDLSEDAAVRTAFESVSAIDHVFVSAGTVAPASVLTSPFEMLQAPFNERVFGALRVVRASVPKMAGGSIVFTTGDLVDRPVPGVAAVSAAAAAVESLAKTCALELAPIRFNVVSPGAIDTPLYTAVFGEQRDVALAAQAEKLPGKRVGSAHEVAEAVLMLMTNEYVNASVLHVDGAMRFV
jgi:NAD(P)-dependent dehydrogenase (short-subunit alcohol dehydrogenase family)